jgi:hypothetical protein
MTAASELCAALCDYLRRQHFVLGEGTLSAQPYDDVIIIYGLDNAIDLVITLAQLSFDLGGGVEVPYDNPDCFVQVAKRARSIIAKHYANDARWGSLIAKALRPRHTTS